MFTHEIFKPCVAHGNVKYPDFKLIYLLLAGLTSWMFRVCTCPSPPLPGAIVVNVADLMQRWTGDRLKSTVRRYLLIQKPVDITTIVAA